MKKTFKTKLRLNSQTIRTMGADWLQHVQGGRPPRPNTDDECDTSNCASFQPPCARACA